MNVTKVFFPPQKEFEEYIDKIWQSGWLTNRGHLVKELEGKLIEYLDVPYLNLTTNGTLPIQIAIKALGVKGEIITTPFSYVATTSSIVWEGCKPVFVDIEPQYYTIDHRLIEKAITPATTSILATHVFGNPCDVQEIQKIAARHGLKVIYDAAHCFGVKYKGQSIFNFGDLSTCSFHATKLFHTGEGGCWVTKDKDLHDKMFYHHNFGHHGQEDFKGVGINAKMCELQAAMGLSVLPYVCDLVASRKMAVDYYLEALKGMDLSFIQIREGTEWNYHYFPVLFTSEEALLRIKSAMNAADIFPRRYFYPSLNNLPYINGLEMPISEDIASRILCLPLSANMEVSDLEKVSSILIKSLECERA